MATVSAIDFEPVDGWAKLPPGYSIKEAPGVTVDAHDNVYVFTRGSDAATDCRVVVFDRDGNFLRSWGEGIFSTRTHGINIDPEGYIWCADDGLHIVRRFTPEGKLVMTLGTENQPAPKWGGKPFNRPTHMCVSPRTGYIYVTDGYGNSCVHKYTPDGRHVLTWGEPGIEPGQFQRPHNVVVDNDEMVFVADRENHRVQVFDGEGKLQGIWHDIHRPDGMTMGPDGLIYIGELCAMDGMDDAPGIGHRISIYDRSGKRVTLFGDPDEGEGPKQFYAPHGVAVDSRGDLYVADVAYTMRGSRMNPPRYPRCFQKLARVR